LTPGRVICNQISPNIVTMIAECAGVRDDHACRTGPDYGHVGGADLMIGLRRLIDADQLELPVAVTASVPYAMGAGIVTAPRAT
jgi:3-oxoacyl-[acyl-carrier-protein] synthase III